MTHKETKENMKSNFLRKQTSRPEMLRGSATLAGGAFLSRLFPVHSSVSDAQRAPSAAYLLASMRARFNAAPIQRQKLADNLTMFSGPGGSVVALNGPDGKFVVDTFVAPAWPKLNEALSGLGNAPVKYVIDTHWHFDHTDNNAPLHALGATVLAHENTKKRMSEPHDLPVLYRGADGALAGLHFDPSPRTPCRSSSSLPLSVASQRRSSRAPTCCPCAHGFGHLCSFSAGQRDFDGRLVF